jgi:CRISPR-associated protein Csh2
MTQFKNRVFGAAIVKAVNSNYNADFSGQPRTLPSGVVYATDKAFKYTIRYYIKDVYDKEIVFFFKRLKDEINLSPLSLFEAYEKHFEKFKKTGDKFDKPDILKNLLKCIDIRYFGATFSAQKSKNEKVSVSIHGPVQINHGINIWQEINIYSEQIMSPFRNPDEKSSDADASTLGRQSKLEEGHYLHHFSVNPKNLEEVVSLAGEGADTLSEEDINKLKEAMRRGATYYDSASKAGTENEFLIWVQLKTESKLVLPNFNTLISMKNEKQDGKVVLDLAKLSEELKKHTSEIENIEIYRNDGSIVIENQPEGAKVFGL